MEEFIISTLKEMNIEVSAETLTVICDYYREKIRTSLRQTLSLLEALPSHPVKQ